jgi:c-di-GMP-binding flagellar brake protein YcgR
MKKINTEKRKHARFPIFEYALLYTNNSVNPARSLIVDISLGGAQLRCRQPCDEDEQGTLHISTSDGESLEIPVEIRYCYSVDNEDLFAVGVRFIPKGRAQKSKIVNYVHKLFLSQGESLLGDFYA